MAQGGLARPARKAWRSGPQAVGVAIDGTGVARGFAEVGAQETLSLGLFVQCLLRGSATPILLE